MAFGLSHQYTWRVFHSSQKTRQKSSSAASGGPLGGLQLDKQAELLEHWEKLPYEQQELVLELARLLVSKKNVSA